MKADAWMKGTAARQGNRWRSHEDGLPQKCTVAADTLSHEGGAREARARLVGEVAADGCVPYAPTDRQRARSTRLYLARRAAVRQRPHPHRHGHQQGTEGYGGPFEVDGRLPLAVHSRLGHPRLAHRVAGREGAGGGEPATGRGRV